MKERPWAEPDITWRDYAFVVAIVGAGILMGLGFMGFLIKALVDLP